MNPRFAAILKALGLLLLALTWTGCSFSRQWKQTLAQPATPHPLVGAWEGQWISDSNGHHGRLRCLITPISSNRFEAFFHAKYKKILSASYKVPIVAEVAGERATFSGESNLGRLAGGVYTYEGTAENQLFQATYRSKYDHGKFEMKRPR